MAIFIAITGAIGSGKTTVLKKMRCLEYDCLSADEVIQALYMSDQTLLRHIHDIAPKAFQDGILNKSLLRQWCIHNNQFHTLEALVHPYFFRFCIEWMHQRRLTPTLYFLEVPLLFETHSQFLFDKVLTVYTPFSVREKRLLQSRPLTPEDIAVINAKQHSSQTAVLSLSHGVINNADQNKRLGQKIGDFIRTLRPV